MSSSFAGKTAAEILSTPAQFAKGIGPQRAELLARLNLFTVRDLLFYFPRTYEDFSEVKTVDQLVEGEAAGVCGVVEEIDMRNTGIGRSLLGVLIRQGDQYLRALWFNQPYLRERFALGQRVVFSGQAKLAGLRWEMHHPKIDWLSPEEGAPKGQVLPVYGLTEGISQSTMRRMIRGVVDHYTEVLDEVFPDLFLVQHNLLPLKTALPWIHNPPDRASLEQARRRFVYQELFILQLALALRKASIQHGQKAAALEASARIDARILRLFPFELTAAQRAAMAEVAADMGRPVPMNRLLQGDVGSGKTVVAIYAMLLAVAHAHQAVLMTPTEVLAQQHFHTLGERLRESRVRIGLLTGSLPAKERQELRDRIAAREIDLVIGTQALLYSETPFARLGLVVIDEQHKFGVAQRAKLRQSGLDPHYLVMTATPIPRTVGMTLFGDLDVSTLREPPPGRQTVHTYFATENQRERWWDFFKKKLREGRQGFVVTPLVDESEQVQAASVQQSFESLAAGELADFRLDFLHGRMTASEKEFVMQRFRSGHVQTLVTTSVVEVGVDVPNATLMTIEGAERFGLAQLHQLRGRVSRGAHPGYVCVFADPKTQESQQRLEAFTKTTDGFELAEIDFALRGPGDLFGTAQHGLPPLRIADLARDTAILEEARRDAQALLAADPVLADPALARVRKMATVRYGGALELSDVG
jgi:ATP-dependent DNA helicase RecG